MTEPIDLNERRKQPRKPKPLPGGGWEVGLLRSRSGEAKKLVANVILVMTNAPEWQGAIAWDEFASRVIIVRHCPAGKPGPWDDVADLNTAEWMQRSAWRIEAGDELVAKAARAVAARQRVHPVRDWLRSLKWDGTKRIDSWLTKYLGADDKLLTRAMARRFLISAVARVMRPGCQVDTMLILEGDQGLRKSSALRALAGDAWFVDASIDVRDKEAAAALAQKWIVEFSELAALRGGDVERVKQFITVRVDNYRQKYGRHFVDYPRQCVFVGTTNARQYLHDTTGNRRFWPVVITLVDLDALVADREQLWAEAVAAFDAGDVWYLDTDELRAEVAEEQEARRAADPWEESVTAWLNNPSRHAGGVTTDDVLAECLKLETSKRTRGDAMRVGAILGKLGWLRKQERRASSRTYVYRLPSNEAKVEDASDAGDDPIPF